MRDRIARWRLAVACMIAGSLWWGEYEGDPTSYRRGYLDGIEHAQRRAEH